MTRYTRSMTTAAAASRPAAARAAMLIAFVLCAALAVAARSDNPKLAPVREGIMQVVGPVFSVLSQPAQAFNDIGQWWTDIAQLRADNAKLRAENDALKHWQSVAMALEAENKELRGLIGYKPMEQTAYIGARIIGYNESALGHSLLIDSGFEDGVRSHQAVITADGLIGRTIDVTAHASRVLILTDMNARVPVVGAISREKAMLAGGGDGMPRLRFVAPSSQLAVGELLVTTEDGGVLPAGIAVGKVFSRSDAKGSAEIRVRPVADAKRATYVRVVSHNTALEAAPNLPQ